MHLALVTTEWYPDEYGGGIGTYCRTLAAQAAAGGHRVTVLAGTASPGRGPRETGRRRVLPVPVPNGGCLAAAEGFRHVWDTSVARQDPPDVVEAADFCGAASLLAETSPVPLVSLLHTPLALLLERDPGGRYYPDDADRCRLESRQIAASALTSPSRWLAAEAVRLWHLPAGPVVVPNPLAPSWLAAQPLPLSGRGEALYAGRLEHRKGVLTLAAALRLLHERGVPLRLRLAGRDTTWRGRRMSDRIVEAARRAHTALRFRRPVGEDALRGLLDRADLVVLPSRFENFPYTCLEAMARGRAVVATTGSGFEEIVEPGGTGLLVPPDDPHALADALEHCAADAAGSAALGAAGRRRVERFAAARVVPHLLDVYAAAARAAAGGAR